MFLRNLLLGENNPLQNRTMHISGYFKKQNVDVEKQNIDVEKQNIDTEKQNIERLAAAGFKGKSAVNVLKLLKAIGTEKVFGRSDAMSVLKITEVPTTAFLKKMLEAGVIVPVKGFGKGKYRFSAEFFLEK